MGANDQGADATQGRWLVIPRSLCFVTHGEDILLLKRGAHRRVYPNKYNGVGGHIERDEDPMQGAIREVEEETGLKVENVRLMGVINIDTGHSNGIMLFVYKAEALSRDFVDSDEGTLEWVALKDALNKDLVEDLPMLLPRLMDEQPFSAYETYNELDQLILRFAGEL